LEESIKWDDVHKPTFILLLRLRHLLETKTSNRSASVSLARKNQQDTSVFSINEQDAHIPNSSNSVAEECLLKGFTGIPSNPQWLSQAQTLELLAQVTPSGDLPLIRQQEWVEKVLSRLTDLEESLKTIGMERANILLDSHDRMRKVTKEAQVKVTPQLLMDILGIYILLPD